jgi:TolA-binding protein
VSRGHRRRARLLLAAAGGLFLAVVAATLMVRARARPYTPGAERAGSEEITRTLNRSLPADVPKVRFTEAAAEAGLRFEHFQGRRSTQLPEDMGSGAAWGDYDNDGDPDLFLVNMAGQLPAGPGHPGGSPARSALFRNDGGHFTDVSREAGLDVGGWGMGAAWGDFDGDGDLDLFVSRYGTNLLFRNNGDGTFTDVTRAAGLGDAEGFWTGVSWADYDRDGDLDLYVCGYVKYRYDAALAGRSSLQYQAQVPFTLNPSTYEPERNLLYRNDGGRFHDVAANAGVSNPKGRSLSAAWADFDGDGWPDLYVANDVSDNAMYHNRGDGTFQDVSHSAWVADYRGAMGLGIGDWDDDGDLDIFITHWLAQENALYANQKGKVRATAAEPMHFVDAADSLGLGQIALDYIGWGTGFLDYDNDGRLDIFAVDGSTFQREDDPALLVPMRNLLFWNGGTERGFFEVGEAMGPPLTTENVGRGAAFADYDGDGDLDIVVVVNGGPARLLRNDGGNAGHWLRVILRGPAPGAPISSGTSGAARGRLRTTTFATGAVVRVTAGGATHLRVIGDGPSYLSQSPPGEAMFGLGAADRVERLDITWPDGRTQEIGEVPANAVVTLREGGAPGIARPAPAVALGVASPAPAVAPGNGAAGAGAESTPPPPDADGRQRVVLFWRTFQEATARRMAGDFAGAESAYRAALAIDPRHEDSLYYVGKCQQEQRKMPEAHEAFERLVAVNPESARGHLALGELLADPDAPGVADLGTAEEHLRRAHAINGEETGPMVRLAELLVVRGNRREAARWFEDAARTNPKSVEAAFMAGYLRWSAGDGAGAAAFYRRAADATAVQAPVKGVLSEGDRRGGAAPGAPPGAARTPAPPLDAPMGRTLFGSFAASVRPAPSPAGSDLDGIYTPVDERVGDLRRRLVPPPPGH